MASKKELMELLKRAVGQGRPENPREIGPERDETLIIEEKPGKKIPPWIIINPPKEKPSPRPKRRIIN